MKKVFLAMMVFLFLVGSAYSATIDITGVITNVDKSQDTVEILYTIPSVTQGTDQVFKVNIRDEVGGISGIYVNTLSPLYDVWASETENATSTDVTTKIYLKDVVYGEGHVFSATTFYSSKENPKVKFIYITVSNSSVTATGADGKIILVFKRL